MNIKISLVLQTFRFMEQSLSILPDKIFNVWKKVSSCIGNDIEAECEFFRYDRRH